MFKLNFLQNIKYLYFQKSFCSTAQPVIIQRVPHTKSELYESLIMLRPNSPENSKTLKISVLGCPNSGKSTLVNMLTRWRVCAVSGKINTTRTKQTVVLTQNNVQLCFIDMPGVIGRKKGFNFKLEKSLIRDPHVGVFESDLVICVVDATHKGSHDELNIEMLKALHFFRDKPSILVLNKIDKVKKTMKLFDMTKRLTDGVVGGKVSHKDKYANRFRKTVSSYTELLKDPRMTELLEKHESPALLECNTVAKNDNGLTEEKIALDTENIIDNIEKEEKDNEDLEVSKTEDESSSRELEVEAEVKEIMKRLYQESGDSKSQILTEDLEADDQIMDVLKAQLMMKSATKEEVMERRMKWREVTNYLNRANETSWKNFDDVFAVSSATGEGIDRLRDYLISRARPGSWYFHSSLVTDQEPEVLVRMCVWATCLGILAKEIPYNLKIEVTNYEKSADGSLHILVTINCRRSRQLMSVIGTKGCNIKYIADHSREILENCFQTDVYLKVVARRVGIPKEHLQRMKSVKNFKDLIPQTVGN